MFERNKDQDKPRGRLANWLSRVFGDKEEPTKAVEAFSLDTPEEPTADEVQTQSRMTDEYKAFLQEQEKTWPQDMPEDTRNVPCAEAEPENETTETPVTEAEPVMEPLPEETAPAEAEKATDEVPAAPDETV